MTRDQLSSWPETGCSRRPAALTVVKQALLLACVDSWERTHARLAGSRLQVSGVNTFCLGMLPWLGDHRLACCFESSYGSDIAGGGRSSNFEDSFLAEKCGSAGALLSTPLPQQHCLRHE